MRIKKAPILLAVLIIIVTILAGCISFDDSEKDEEKEPIPITEILYLNVSKNITIEGSNYNITITKIEGENIVLTIDGQDEPINAIRGIPVELDNDLDGTNDLEINITEIIDSQVKITIITTASMSKYTYIQDDIGITVKVPKKIDRIISLAPSITEILFELKVGDKIVGRDSASNYPADAHKIDIVSTYEGIDLESILVKEPDIIFMDKTLDASETNYNLMKEFGLCVFRVYPKSLQDVLDNIEILGKATDSQTTAQEIVTNLKSRIDIVKTRESNQPKVLYVVYYDGSSSPWVGTTSTFSGDLIQIAGGRPVLDDNSGLSIQITIEHIIGLDPEIIFTSQDETWPTPSRQAILDDDALSEVKAVKNDMVIDVNADFIDRPGPRMVDGLELLSNYITS